MVLSCYNVEDLQVKPIYLQWRMLLAHSAAEKLPSFELIARSPTCPDSLGYDEDLRAIVRQWRLES